MSTRRPRRALKAVARGGLRAGPLVLGAAWLTLGTGCALAVLLVAGAWSRPAPLVSAFPIPGSRMATPQTQIAFRGVSIKNLGPVEVTGSRSGRHAGRLESDSDNDGASFVPARQFVPGELVTVKTRLDVRGGKRGRFQFRVATPAGALPNMLLPTAARVPGDTLQFNSRPDLTPPAVKILQARPGKDEGYLFLTPQEGPLQDGPMIVSDHGELIWFHPIPKGQIAANLRVQTYRGQPVLTWWQGQSGAGVGFGEDIIMNANYRPVRVVHAGNGLSADLHEFVLTRKNTALITAYFPVFWRVRTPTGIRRLIVLDSVVQEIDIPTGLVLFQWDSLDHVPAGDSYELFPHNSGNPYDYFHINSVQPLGSSDLLVSARNTWAAYDISRTTGAVRWMLGGKRSTFKLGPGAKFAFQHDVRAHANAGNTVTLFDDEAGPPRQAQRSRGVTLKLDARRRTATLVRSDEHSPALLADYEGNVQTLPNGDHLLGWGQQPYFTEFNPDGRVVFDGRFVGDNSTYRVYAFPWVGRPRAAPNVAASTSGASTTVYASWNGATDVASWQVLAGSSADSLSPVTVAANQGFETALQVPASAYVAVEALDAQGRVLGRSQAAPAS